MKETKESEIWINKVLSIVGNKNRSCDFEIAESCFNAGKEFVKQEVLKEVSEIEVPDMYHGLKLKPKKLKDCDFYKKWLEENKKE